MPSTGRFRTGQRRRATSRKRRRSTYRSSRSLHRVASTGIQRAVTHVTDTLEGIRASGVHQQGQHSKRRIVWRQMKIPEYCQDTGFSIILHSSRLMSATNAVVREVSNVVSSRHDSSPTSVPRSGDQSSRRNNVRRVRTRAYWLDICLVSSLLELLAGSPEFYVEQMHLTGVSTLAEIQ